MAGRDLRTGVKFRVTIDRSATDRRWVLATLRRCWYDVGRLESGSSLVAETWINVHGMTEAETLAAALQDLRLAVLDSLA